MIDITTLHRSTYCTQDECRIESMLEGHSILLDVQVCRLVSLLSKIAICWTVQCHRIRFEFKESDAWHKGRFGVFGIYVHDQSWEQHWLISFDWRHDPYAYTALFFRPRCLLHVCVIRWRICSVASDACNWEVFMLYHEWILIRCYLCMLFQPLCLFCRRALRLFPLHKAMTLVQSLHWFRRLIPDIERHQGLSEMTPTICTKQLWRFKLWIKKNIKNFKSVRSSILVGWFDKFCSLWFVLSVCHACGESRRGRRGQNDRLWNTHCVRSIDFVISGRHEIHLRIGFKANQYAFIYIFPSAAILMKIHRLTPDQCLRRNRPEVGLFLRRHWSEVVTSLSQQYAVKLQGGSSGEWGFSDQWGTEMSHCESLWSSPVVDPFPLCPSLWDLSSAVDQSPGEYSLADLIPVHTIRDENTYIWPTLASLIPFWNSSLYEPACRAIFSFLLGTFRASRK